MHNISTYRPVTVPFMKDNWGSIVQSYVTGSDGVSNLSGYIVIVMV